MLAPKIWRRTYVRAAFTPAFTAAPLSGRTHVSADIKHVLPPRQQNPRNPRARKTTAHTPAHTSVKFQLLLDLVAACCQSAWRGQEWLAAVRNEGRQDVGTFFGGRLNGSLRFSQLKYNKYKKARRPCRNKENSTLKTRKTNDCRQKGA